MVSSSMADSPETVSSWLAGPGEPVRPAVATKDVSLTATDPEDFHEHLRPAWHVVAATGEVLAAAVLASWLGH